MECLTPTVSFDLFMDKYFHIRGRGVFNKNRLRKYTIIGDKQLQKKECGQFEQCSAHQAKMLCNLCDWLERQGALQSFF